MSSLEFRGPVLLMVVIALALAAWVFLDTNRALLWLSLKRRKAFAAWELAFFRVDAALVGLGMLFILLVNICRRL